MKSSTVSSANGPTNTAANLDITLKLTDFLKSGALAGIMSAIVNNIWNFTSPYLGAARMPQMINFMSVSLASIIPALVAGIGFWIGIKLFKKNGPKVFGFSALVLTFLSTIGNFKSTLPDGSITPPGFALLTVPMHFFAGILIIAILLRMVRNGKFLENRLAKATP